MLRRVTASAGAVLVAATGLTVGLTGSAEAATCYGGQMGFKTEQGRTYVPTSGWYKTSSRCQDINVWIAAVPTNLKGRNVKVCFQNGGCQSAFTYARVNDWTVIATNVKDNTTFRLAFDTTNQTVGNWAA